MVHVRHSLQASLVIVPLAVAIVGGCVGPRLNSARHNFYRGDFRQAVTNLTPLALDKRNNVLILMERGMSHQARGNYEASVDDWNAAVEEAKRLDYYSLSQGAASILSNDEAMAFRGAPYERTLLHAFAAKSYLALQMWEDAAVEARNIIDRLENLDGFPDDAYCHYLAGFCLEMINDHDGAAFQYRAASKLMPTVKIDENTGRIGTGSGKPARSGRPEKGGAQLVCFISMGSSPSVSGIVRSRYAWGPSPYAEIYSGGKLLGHSHAFSNTGSLLSSTEKRLAAVRIVKETTRIVIKDAAANAVSRENEFLGELLRWFLFALETPDRRRWETLPNLLHVARVPCPPDLKNYRVVFKTTDGRTLAQKTIDNPLARRDNVFVSFCRDIQCPYQPPVRQRVKKSRRRIGKKIKRRD